MPPSALMLPCRDKRHFSLQSVTRLFERGQSSDFLSNEQPLYVSPQRGMRRIFLRPCLPSCRTTYTTGPRLHRSIAGYCLRNANGALRLRVGVFGRGFERLLSEARMGDPGLG